MDRMTAIVMALQVRSETAASLAAKFEVSRRTILRDVQALSEMDIPIVALPGAGGGYRLPEDYTLPPLQLDKLEAVSLLFALRSLESYPDTPFHAQRWTVLDKIHALLPAGTLEALDPLLSQLEHRVPKRSYAIPDMEPLFNALTSESLLRVWYRSASRERWLTLTPRKIYASAGFWYCEAFTLEHGEERLLRIDRMTRMEQITQDQGKSTEAACSGEIPFISIPDAGAVSSSSPLPRPSFHNIRAEPFRVRARLTYRGMIRVEQDEHIGEKICQHGDDYWEVDFLCPSGERDWAIRFFYELGPEAEVLEPAEFRSRIAERAQAVLNQYQS
ncbi:WYL domain-containing protein [Paenibacillus sp. JX-17]|uniref:WYL domain-containing protein n=1 Tax=Paenibacillus lacisoli TaxID=3064525 RepID=A0ABT9C9G2_9BACL|nr:WYL domain-containing protein [Paenibacillus sp. JX-17]MDO7905897.1 WYL domain-containing protein [Paenibacillus sp. JX-17]